MKNNLANSLVKLADLLSTDSNENEVANFLASFKCAKNLDVESFLHTKAIEYEKLGRSRTFLIIKELDGDLVILGYFTLAIHVYQLASSLSNTLIKKLHGNSYKSKGRGIEYLPVILIAQLAKNDLYKDLITGMEIMKLCMYAIELGRSYVGGRLIIVECKDVKNLIAFYSSFGFKLIDSTHSDLKQLFLIL